MTDPRPTIDRDPIHAHVRERVVVRYDDGPVFLTMHGIGAPYRYDEERATTPLRVLEVRFTLTHYYPRPLGDYAKREREVLAVRIRKDGSDGAEVLAGRYRIPDLSPKLLQLVDHLEREHASFTRPRIDHPSGVLR